MADKKNLMRLNKNLQKDRSTVGKAVLVIGMNIEEKR